MKHLWIWIAACILVLQAVHIEQAHSQGIHNTYEWEYEPDVDGTLHKKIKITLSTTYREWGFSTWILSPATNLKAWEADSGAPIDVSEEIKGDRIHYTIELPGAKGKGFAFVVEFDQLFAVRETQDEIYSFSDGWTSPYETTHIATIKLPKKHELLFTEDIQPKEVTSSMGRTTIRFEEELPEDGTFQFTVTFSKEGVQLTEKAESNYRLGQYSDAKKAYQDAIDFYSQFDELYGKDAKSFLADLKSKVAECEAKTDEESDLQSQQQAEEKLNEAKALFDAGDYAKAQPIFQQAQNMYLSAGNSEKADECQSYIDQCKQFAAKTEAGIEAKSLFDEGISLFEQQQYAEAKTKFEEALVKYKELQDEDKIKECEEWIASCEEEAQPEEGKEGEDGGGPCIGSSLIVIALLGAALTRAFRYRS